MTIIELINECITTLSSVRPSVDDLQTIAIPVRQTKDKLVVLKKYLEEQNKPAEEDKE